MLHRLASGALWLVSLICLGCGSDSDDGGSKSCGGQGTLAITAGSFKGTGSVTTVIGSPSTTVSILSDPCTGDASGSLYDVPAQPGTHSFTVPNVDTGTVVVGPNMTLGLPGSDYTVGFDSILSCKPCGSGTVTVTASDASHVAGSIDATAWEIVGGPGGLGTSSTSPLAVTGTFEATWE